MAKPLPVGATLLLLVALAFADGARAAAPAQYEHDAAGRRVALKLPNGVKTTYAHDAAGRLTKVESKNAAGNVISAFGYALDATGNRTAMDVTLNGVHNRIEYAFDNAYRLTRETRKDAAGNVIYDEGLTYDPVGNRLARTRTQTLNGQIQTENTVYAYNNANQLLTETTNGVTTAYGYDKNGNNTTISTPAANGNPAKNIAMTYDWLNRQTKWTDGERTESTVFAGADWKRASTTVTMGANAAAAPPTVTKYLYDGDNVLADFGNDDALTAFYVTPGLDQNLSITDASGQTAYYTQDGLGSVRTLTAANGAILNRYDYTAFGETFAPNTSTTISNRYTYTAREQSPLAAHGAPMYYRWRNYAPSVGRFMWRDPIDYDGGFNLYAYCVSHPVGWVDPYGTDYIDVEGDVAYWVSEKCTVFNIGYKDVYRFPVGVVKQVPNYTYAFDVYPLPNANDTGTINLGRLERLAKLSECTGCMSEREARDYIELRVRSINAILWLHSGALFKNAKPYVDAAVDAVMLVSDAGLAVGGASATRIAKGVAENIGRRKVVDGYITITHRGTPESIAAKVAEGKLPANMPRHNNWFSRLLDNPLPAVWVSEGQPTAWNRLWPGMWGRKGSASVTFDVPMSWVRRPRGWGKMWFGKSQRIIEHDVPIPSNAKVRMPKGDL